MQQAPVPQSLPLSAAPAARLPRFLGLVLFTAALALSAQIRVPLPFTPVPVTLQTVVVGLAAALLGRGAGVGAVLAYLALGAAGLPVYSGGGAGLAHLFGPTCGYLVGFVAAAALIGALPVVGRPAWAIALVLVAGEALVHLLGVLGLSATTGLPLREAFVQGSLIFWPAAFAKIGFTAAVLRLYGQPLARRLRDAKDGD